FGRAASHDLREPLRALDGFATALAEDFGDALDEDATFYLARIHAAGERLAERIEALLTLSQLIRRPFAPAPLDLAPLAQLACTECARACPERRIDWSIAPGLWTTGDPLLLNAALRALIDNAIKFSACRDPANVEVGQRDGAFFVRDDGVGFDPAFGDRIFQAFTRYHTPDEFPGLGMGLALASCAVERHGGRLWAETVEGEGATFWFTLTPGTAR
ncbi:MAG: PAS domain-containing sensor histidine kinase, partial [Myxococcales bacterium]|nr:PAS domain-containing sensor histidine kinase [Myxococcales bacterium]